MKHEHATPAEQLVSVMTRIYESRLTTPSGGNLSILDADGGLWVTPRQIDKGRLTPAHMIRIAPDGQWTSSASLQPTSEWPFHLAVLNARPDRRAVAHAHPTSLVAFSVVGKPLPLHQFPDLCRWIGRVGFAAYAIPGSQKLGDLLAECFAAGCDAALMENHGAVACGHDLFEAFLRFEAMEHLAAILAAGARLGTLREQPSLESAQRSPCAREPINVDPALQASQSHEREELADYVRRAHGRGLLGSVTGALSCRCGDGMLITADGADAATASAAQLVYVAGERCERGKIPSALVELHTAIYRAHPQVRSVATALPVQLMAFAATGVPFDARTIPEAYMFLKTVPTLAFAARFDGAQVADALGPTTPMALVESACAVVTGASLFSVFDRLEVAEFTARSILDSASLGPLKPMPDDVLKEISRVYG